MLRDLVYAQTLGTIGCNDDGFLPSTVCRCFSLMVDLSSKSVSPPCRRYADDFLWLLRAPASLSLPPFADCIPTVFCDYWELQQVSSYAFPLYEDANLWWLFSPANSSLSPLVGYMPTFFFDYLDLKLVPIPYPDALGRPIKRGVKCVHWFFALACVRVFARLSSSFWRVSVVNILKS